VRLASRATSVVRKNRLDHLRLVGFAFGLSQSIQARGLVHGLVGRSLARGGLQFFELRRVLVNRPLDVLLIHRQQMEIVGLFAPGAGLGESVIDLSVAGVVDRVLLDAQGERAVFDRAGSLKRRRPWAMD
jgi:hypothetical protein